MKITGDNLTATISRTQNKLVRKLLDAEAAAYKNWTASAVESGDFERAKRLVEELREVQALFHTFVPDDCWEMNRA